MIVHINYEWDVSKALDNVTDPEMPFISIKELGMVNSVKTEGDHVHIELLPTFSGCPALDMIKEDVLRRVKSEVENIELLKEVHVEFKNNPPWTTDRISNIGKKKLKENGITPPPARHTPGEPWVLECPFCDSEFVTLENIFGPTACRSILYCNSCHNPFEAMKPIATIS